MKRIGNIFTHILDFDTLRQAAHHALRGKRTRPDCASYLFSLEHELIILRKELSDGTYRPLPCRCFSIYEPKERKICAAPFRDRVVHHAICMAVDPVFERHFIDDTYACRKGKGVHKAVERAQHFSRKNIYFLSCDIRKFYESIDHIVLKDLLRRMFKEQSFLDLLNLIIDHPVPGYAAGKGIPIGNLTSQYFANFYLSGFDHTVKEVLRIKGYVRYMDDFILFDQSRNRLREALSSIDEYLACKLRLSLKQKAVICAPVTQGLSFLGFRVFPGLVRIKGSKWRGYMKKARLLSDSLKKGVIDDESYSMSIASMTAHIMHADTREARRRYFSDSMFQDDCRLKR